MTMEMEGMELSGHGEDENDIYMGKDSQENSPSHCFAATMDEHSTRSITTTDSPSKGVCITGEVYDDNEKKALTFCHEERRNEAEQPITINEFNIGNINCPTLINIPLEITRNSNDFYHTPDNNTHKDDENVSSTKYRLHFGAKTATSRALDFSDQVSAVPKTSTRISNQSTIPYRCRKRKLIPSDAKSPGKRHYGEDGEERHSGCIENYFNIGNIRDSCLSIGNNNKIDIFYDSKKALALGVGEDVEADGSSQSISPVKSLKVTADENSEIFMVKFQDIINNLHPLRDKGRYEEFNVEAERIAGSSAEPHIQILVLIEKSMALSYQKEFAASKKVVDEILKMISNPEVQMKNFLLAYLHVHQTGLSRRQNRLTEADGFVSTAKQCEECIPFGIIRVFVVYEHASNLSKMLSLMSVDEEEPWQIKKEDATKSLRECISLSQRIHEENSSIYLQRKQFSLVKLALLNLNCRTKTARTNPVNEENINEAECCLNEMEECEGDMSEALSTQFYVAKSDLHFRKKNFLQSKAFAEQALGIAMDNNLTLEILPIQEKLKDIDQLL